MVDLGMSPFCAVWSRPITLCSKKMERAAMHQQELLTVAAQICNPAAAALQVTLANAISTNVHDSWLCQCVVHSSIARRLAIWEECIMAENI